MRTLVPWLLVIAVLPRVENPWPDTIGLGLPVMTAIAGMVLAGVAFTKAARERRDDAQRWGLFLGFLMGAVFYFVALMTQVVSGR
jgi:hypothetical protein